ncbi:HXXEE domain-containing protein [Winogradskyella sp. 3972H.M.0a.05]|uniref:HXXEE domain-containing protein n=1 Tax=Winogradskyella sp. 3972H.M.0a.05 TaxID=2950277 RepID=UPI003395ABA6
MTYSPKVSRLFLALVILQAIHSIEEYIGKLWDNFPPATYVCSLVSDDLHFGFLVINIGLFVLGILCWLFLVRTNHNLAILPLGFWIFIELVNGIGHPIWTIVQKGYTPGVITAPFLLLVAILLIKAICDGRARSLKS